METFKSNTPTLAYGRILPPEQVNQTIIDAMIPFCEEEMDASDPNRKVLWFGTTRIEQVYKDGKLVLERRIEGSSPEEFCGTPAGVALYCYTKDGRARREETYTPRPDGTWQMINRGLIFGEPTKNGLVWPEDLYLDDNV